MLGERVPCPGHQAAIVIAGWGELDKGLGIGKEKVI